MKKWTRKFCRGGETSPNAMVQENEKDIYQQQRVKSFFLVLRYNDKTELLAMERGEASPNMLFKNDEKDIYW